MGHINTYCVYYQVYIFLVQVEKSKISLILSFILFILIYIFYELLCDNYVLVTYQYIPIYIHCNCNTIIIIDYYNRSPDLLLFNCPLFVPPRPSCPCNTDTLSRRLFEHGFLVGHCRKRRQQREQRSRLCSRQRRNAFGDPRG